MAEHRTGADADDEASLRPRLRFETFLADLGSRLMQQAAPDVPRAIDVALAELVELLEVDRCGIALFSPDKTSLCVVHGVARAGIADLRGEDLAPRLPWWSEQLRRGRRMAFSVVSDELPEDAEAERRFVADSGLRSHTVIPLAVGDEVLGALGVASLRRARDWPRPFLERLEVLAALFAHAVYRCRAEDQISAAEQLSRAILRALPSEVIVLDGNGQVIALNEAARRASHGTPPVAQSEGSDYLAALASGDGADDAGGRRAAQGIRGVLSGRKASFETTHACGTAGRQCLLHAVPLEGRPGVVLVQTDVSELERTKAALDTSLRELGELKDRLEAENVLLHREVRHERGFESIVGCSAAFGHVLSQIEQVAPTDAPVLLLGETGTGKDLVARTLHDRSRRRERPLVTINCAALPATLIESELFGYERGAFTGALQRTVGRFELANQGTIFLDEIGELPGEVQAKLLRVVQSGEFERLGSARTIRTDVRLIAATNRNLEQAMREQRFRPDLYYRLSVFPVRLPPLRARPEDIPLLVWHFVASKQGQLGRSISRIPDRLMRALCAYPWPGNVRELENVVERALILSQDSTLAADPVLFAPEREESQAPAGDSLEDVERAHIRAVLSECSWKVSGPGNAADRLGLNRSTLQFRMKKLGIARPRAVV